MLDDVEPLPRDPLAPFRMSVIDRFKDMGTIAMGKSEAGLVRKNDRLYVMPNKCARVIALPSAQMIVMAAPEVCLLSLSVQIRGRFVRPGLTVSQGVHSKQAASAPFPPCLINAVQPFTPWNMMHQGLFLGVSHENWLLWTPSPKGIHKQGHCAFCAPRASLQHPSIP